MFERFTTEARHVVHGARQEANQLRHRYVGTEHILLALLSRDAGPVHLVLREAGLDAPRVRTDIERLLGTSSILGPDDAAALRTIGIDLDAVLARIEDSFGPDAVAGPLPKEGRGAGFTRRAKKVLELSLREAVRLRHKHIGAEHILLGLIREGDGLAARVIFDAGIDPDDLRRAVLTRLDDAA